MFDKDLWESWKKQELNNYEISSTNRPKFLKKNYVHLDARFWFPQKSDEIEELIKRRLLINNPSTGRNEYYSFSPFIKILTKTPRYRYQFLEGHYDLETKIRPISYAAHKDSLIMGYYSYAITKVYEKYIKENGFSEVVLAYRTDLGKCNIQFAKDVFDIVKSKKKCSAIALDIKGYFDHIDHQILLEKWKKILSGSLPEDQFRLYKILTTYSYINQKSLLKKYFGPAKRNSKLPSTLMDLVPGKNINEKFKKLKADSLIVSNNKPNKKTKRLCGIPQGSPISALLSNIYLIDFDKDLYLKGELEGFAYRRYCDDILVVCDSDKAYELVNFVIDKILNEYFLTIQVDKVDLIDFHKNSKGKIRGFRRPRKTQQSANGIKRVTLKEFPAKTNAISEEKYYKPLQYLGFEYNGKNITIRPGSLSRFFRKLNYRLERTVIMAHSPQSVSDQIFTRQIYERYTHVGSRNFLSYAFKAAKKTYEDTLGVSKYGLDSPAIRKQLRNHFKILRYELQRKNEKWFSHKSKGKKVVTPKYI